MTLESFIIRLECILDDFYKNLDSWCFICVIRSFLHLKSAAGSENMLFCCDFSTKFDFFFNCVLFYISPILIGFELG